MGQPVGRNGQVAVDLHACQKYLILNPDIHESDELLIYYLTEDGMWIKYHQMTEFQVFQQATGDPELDEREFNGIYEDADPVWAAHDIYWAQAGLLPPRTGRLPIHSRMPRALRRVAAEENGLHGPQNQLGVNRASSARRPAEKAQRRNTAGCDRQSHFRGREGP